MTAIVGLNCTDGVLLLADTEETISDEAKSECDKLSLIHSAHGRVLIGGAGNSHSIEYAEQIIERDFLKQPRNWNEIYADLNSLAKKINKDTLGFYKGFAAEIVPNGIEMLLAVNVDNQTVLYRWQNDSVVEIAKREHASIGSGVIQTHSLIRDLNIRLGADAMLFYGVRLMKHTKRTVTGVGGKTEAAVLHDNGTLGVFSTGITTQIEELIAEVDAFTHRSFLSLIADVHSKDEEFENLLSQVADKIRLYRKRYRQRY